MTSGYNKPDSMVWHAEQRCSGTFFPAMAEMDSKAAETRGLRPCSKCADGEWPHEDEEAERDPEEYRDKIEPGETALKFTSSRWDGPEYVGEDEDGTFITWPVGLDRNVVKETEQQFEKDIKNPDISIEEVAFEETPLTEWSG